MKHNFGLKQMILITVFYLFFTLIDVTLDKVTGIHWISPSDLNQFLSLIALGLLWIWYFADKYQRK